MKAFRAFPQVRRTAPNEKLQLACTLALIFAMGVSLGGGGRFFASLAFIGGQSLLFCLVPTAGSIAAVYLLSRRFMDGGAPGAEQGPKRAVSAAGDPMVFLAAGSRAARGPSPRRTSSRCPPIPTACSCSSCSPLA